MSDVFIDSIVESSIDGDFLNRQKNIQRIQRVIELIASSNKNACFAISGSWGIGKSYVLDKLEKRLLFKQDGERAADKYYVFHFNCWEYDYYEEPLIAIVSSMLDDINSKEHLFSEEARARIRSVAKFVLSKLYEGGSKWLESKIGLNPKEITDGISEACDNATARVCEAHSYDQYLDFKQALLTLRKEIKEIASERTIIFVVDELDRCIPEYQIKVLERIHHVFNEIENMQVILAVDKTQLERTIQKMFGDKVDTQKYLAKFIKFEIELDEGTYNDQFEEIHGYYFNQFEKNDQVDVIEFQKNIFTGIEAREKIAIIEKCHLLHNLLNEDDEIMDETYMCVELFLIVLKHTKANLPYKANGIFFSELFGKTPTAGLQFVHDKMSHQISYPFSNETRRKYYYSEGNRHYIIPSDLWGILLGCYAHITETHFDGYSNCSDSMDQIEDYAERFWDLLRAIK